MSLRDKLNTTKLIIEGNKNNIYASCKHLSEYISGGLSSLQKEELLLTINSLNNYKNSLENMENTENKYKQFVFDTKNVKLDEEQHKIVIADPNYHYRIIAGAGSGKTTTILCRIKYLVDNFVAPNKILLLTFNVDACQSLKKRIVQLFGFNINVNIRTIDSFACQINWKYNSSLKQQNGMKASISEFSGIGSEIMLQYGKEISSEYRYVFFDEFQDVNLVQFNILKVFAENGCFLTVVGDCDQNIYMFRQTSNFFILNFDRILENTVKTMTILTNYRSISRIVHAANDSIKNNTDRIDKNMKSMKPLTNESNRIKLLVYESKKSQFNFIIKTIKEGIEKGNKYDDYVILSRSSEYLKLAEEFLQKQQFPYVALITDKKNKNDESKPIIIPGKITITTIHRSKGLEWKTVFFIGLCDQHFPSHTNNNLKNISEDRRLFYVGITRAKTYLYLVANMSEMPLSRFLREIYTDHIILKDHTKGKNLNGIFGTDNQNQPKLSYCVTEIITMLQYEQLKEMRELGLVPDQEPEEIDLFSNMLSFNELIKANYFESDFGNFVDHIITRYIMINNEQEVKDTDCELLINGIDLSDDDMAVYNKYNLKNLIRYNFFDKDKIMLQLASIIQDEKELLIANKICNMLDKDNDFRKVNTYPKYFMDLLNVCYKKYTNSEKTVDEILQDIYYVSLCRKIVNDRRRLIYRNIFDIYMTEFNEINERIKSYVNLMKDNVYKCKISTTHVYHIKNEFVKLSGELDAFDKTNQMIIDFKCSESGTFKIEWALQILMYCAIMLKTEKITRNEIKNISVFNVLSGKQYKLIVPDDYNFDQLLDYVEKLIENDMSGKRENDCISLEFLQNYGKNVDGDDSNDDFNNIIIKKEKKIVENRFTQLIQNNNYSVKKYLSFDVETGSTGTVNNIIQLAYVIYDEDQNELKRVNHYVKDRMVDNMLEKIHHITTKFLAINGIQFDDVIYDFLVDLNDCSHVIGHNVSSDIKHIRTNMDKFNITIKYDPFFGKIIEDTMKLGKTTNKSPKLGELHELLFGQPIVDAHNALVDSECTAKCYFELINIKEAEQESNSSNKSNNSDEEIIVVKTEKSKNKKKDKKKSNSLNILDIFEMND
jgi:DNA polymerase III epsilon subunit-like protein